MSHSVGLTSHPDFVHFKNSIKFTHARKCFTPHKDSCTLCSCQIYNVHTRAERGKKNLEQISSVFTEEIYRTSVSSIPTALTNPPTAYQIKPPLEAQTHSLSHTQTHVCKNNPLPAWGSRSHVQQHCSISPDLPGFLQPNWPADWPEQNYFIDATSQGRGTA